MQACAVQSTDIDSADARVELIVSVEEELGKNAPRAPLRFAGE